MKKWNLTMLAISGLGLLLAAPLPAQTLRVVANIPFEFVTGGQTLPAGEYILDTVATNGVVRIWNQSTNERALALANSVSEPFVRPNAQVTLTFQRYGNQHFLRRIWNGYDAVGREIPMSKAEQALTAKSNVPETLVILARR